MARIYNTTANTVIALDSSVSNYIANDVQFVTIHGGSKSDTIQSDQPDVVIYTGGGNDEITVWENSTVSVDSGGYKTTVSPYVQNGGLAIYGSWGSDTIEVKDDSTIITNETATPITITGEGGNDYIIGSKKSPEIFYYTDGHSKDTIANFGENDTLVVSPSVGIKSYYDSGSDFVFYFKNNGSVRLKNVGDKNILANFSGTTYVFPLVSQNQHGDEFAYSTTVKENSTNSTTVVGTVIDDSISNSGNYVTVDAGNGNDTISNDGVGVVLNGGEGDDYIFTANGGETNSTISGGSGNDTIISYDRHISISGGSGDDTIKSNGSDCTISGGAGNDTITVGIRNSFIQFFAGDGQDIIYDITSTDTIDVGNSAYSTVTSGNDVILNIDSGTAATIVGGAGINFQVQTTYMPPTPEPTTEPVATEPVATEPVATEPVATEPVTTEPVTTEPVTTEPVITEPVTTDPVTTDPVTTDPVTTDPVTPININVTNTSVTNVTNISSTTVINNAFNFRTTAFVGGNQIISDFASGEKINYSADFTGIGFTETDFMINSSSGSLTIQNARDKIMDVAVNNQTVAYAYMASGGGEIDGSSFSLLEVILGANNSDNNISAGSGGSSLWGGVGGNDILTGGTGVDEIFFGKNDGADKIFNAGSSDVVNLYDVTLADIATANISGNVITANLNSGGSLQINSAENFSATFKLVDGNFKYNHSSGEWQSA